MLRAESRNSDYLGDKFIYFLEACLILGTARLIALGNRNTRGEPRRIGTGEGQRAAGTADGNEQMGMPEAEGEGAEAAHGQPGDGTPLSSRLTAESTVDEGNQILDDVIFPVIQLTIVAAGIIYKPAVATVRQHQDQIFHVARIKRCPQVAAPHGVVLHITMQKIEHRIAFFGGVIIPG